MANTSLYIKGSRTKVLDIFPPKSLGKEGDFIISRIAGKGVYLCTKVGGSWYAANRLEELKKLGKTSISDLTTKTLSIKSLVNSSNNTDKILVSDLTSIKYRTNNELFKDLNIPIEQINYKTAHCSLAQYNNKEDCWANGGSWYYSENDSHDSISNTAENELLTIGSSIGKLDAESTLTYDGSTLEIKRNTNYDDNWQTSVQDTLLKLSYDSTNSVSMEINSSGDFTITPSRIGGDTRLVSTLRIDTITEIGSDTDKILMSDGGIVKYVDGATLRGYIGAGTSSFGGALNDLSDVTYSSGDLTITSLDTIVAGGSLTLDAVSNIVLNSDSGVFQFKDDTLFLASFSAGTFNFNYDASNYTRTSVSSAGVLTIASNGGTATDADLILDAGGDVVLDSGTGVFIAKKGGTEFSAANSSYAGMILGYTDIGLDEPDFTYNLTTSYAVIHASFNVAFVAPPSGNVEIYIQVQFNAGSSGAGDLHAGLSDNSTYNAVEDFHEVELIDQSGRFGLETVQHSWTLTGLTAGTSYQIWAGFKSSSTTGTPTINYGSNASDEYPDFIMKAIALPATIAT